MKPLVRIERWIDALFNYGLMLPLKVASRTKSKVGRLLCGVWLFPWIIISSPLSLAAIGLMGICVFVALWEGDV